MNHTDYFSCTEWVKGSALGLLRNHSKLPSLLCISAEALNANGGLGFSCRWERRAECHKEERSLTADFAVWKGK